MNQFTSNFWKRLATVFLIVGFLGLSGCASGSNVSASSKVVIHAFDINGWYDNPAWAKQADLLAYSYGDQYHMVRRAVKPGEQTLGYSSGVSGPMPVGEFLYVKWRIKATGEELEDKVDLRNRLPANMFEHKVTFVIDGKQLYVYLVTPQTKSTGTPPFLKTRLSDYYVTHEIYPNNTYKK